MTIYQMVRSVVLVPLVAFASFIYAEALTGKVTDSETGEPLAGAQVFVKGTFVGTTTDVSQLINKFIRYSHVYEIYFFIIFFFL